MEFQTETASLEHGTSSRNETAYLVCKRAFDIAASFCALVVLSPVFLIIYLVSTEQIPIFAAAIKSAKSAQTGAKGYAGFYADSTLQSTWQA